jgi:hypothetical protein
MALKETEFRRLVTPGCGFQGCAAESPPLDVRGLDGQGARVEPAHVDCPPHFPGLGQQQRLEISLAVLL